MIAGRPEVAPYHTRMAVNQPTSFEIEPSPEHDCVRPCDAHRNYAILL